MSTNSEIISKWVYRYRARTEKQNFISIHSQHKRIKELSVNYHSNIMCFIVPKSTSNLTLTGVNRIFWNNLGYNTRRLEITGKNSDVIRCPLGTHCESQLEILKIHSPVNEVIYWLPPSLKVFVAPKCQINISNAMPELRVIKCKKLNIDDGILVPRLSQISATFRSTVVLPRLKVLETFSYLTNFDQFYPNLRELSTLGCPLALTGHQQLRRIECHEIRPEVIPTFPKLEYLSVIVLDLTKVAELVDKIPQRVKYQIFTMRQGQKFLLRERC